MNTILYPYQEEGVEAIQRFKGRALLADEMGLGKSLQALAWIRTYCEPGPVIVVCPAHLKEHWRREAAKHVGIRAEVLSTSTPPRGSPIARPRVYIINYDVLQHWVAWLLKLNPVAVIGDEVQFIKSITAKRTKAFRLLCSKVSHVIGISGTPLTNRPAELWPMLSILLPAEYGSFTSFAFQHCSPERKPWGWEYKGAVRLDKLHTNLRAKCMVRRLKTDVLDQLPPKTRTVVPFKASAKSMKEYTHAKDDLVSWLKTTHPSRVYSAVMAERLVRLGYLKRLAAKIKLDLVIQWIDTFLEETDEKLIMFGVHKSVLETLHERYKKTSVLVTGSVKGLDRQHRFDKFNRDAGVRLFFGNIKAAGTGWSCTSTSKVAFVELEWTPGEHIQAEDRVHGLKRGKGKDPMTAYYFVTEGTIEEDLCKIIQDKQKVLTKTLDGKGKMKTDLNIYDRMEQILLRRN